MKYIVYWVLTTLISVPCPDAGADEYGATSFSSCAALHLKAHKINKQTIEHHMLRATHKINKQKEFDNRKDALDFYNKAKARALNHGGWIMDPRISHVKMDSIKIKEK